MKFFTTKLAFIFPKNSASYSVSQRHKLAANPSQCSLCATIRKRPKKCDSYGSIQQDKHSIEGFYANKCLNCSADKLKKLMGRFCLADDNILVEMFAFFSRTELTQIQLVCARFRRTIDQCFPTAPLLIFTLNIHINSEQGRFSLQQVNDSSDVCVAFSEDDIVETEVPQYMRINRVCIEPPGLTTYSIGWLPWMAILPAIKHLKPALQNYDLVYAIDPNRFDFVLWANAELLSLFEQPTAHGVLITPLEEIRCPTEVAWQLATVLRLSTVRRCSSLCINFPVNDYEEFAPLIVDAVLDWLCFPLDAEDELQFTAVDPAELFRLISIHFLIANRPTRRQLSLNEFDSIEKAIKKGFQSSCSRIGFRVELYIGYNKAHTENFSSKSMRKETLKSECTDDQLNIWKAVSKRKRKTMLVIERASSLHQAQRIRHQTSKKSMKM